MIILPIFVEDCNKDRLATGSPAVPPTKTNQLYINIVHLIPDEICNFDKNEILVKILDGP